MNNSDLIYSYEPLWGSWKIDSLIGTGSTGNVYKVIKNDYNRDYISAVKFIQVPTHEQYKSVLSYFNNGDKKSISEYFESIVQAILNEIELLYDLKEHGNIINYEDHLIKKIEGKDEWNILIRMEYANSLDIHIMNTPISEKDIIKVGIDICSALEFCHKKNILHRDIKEANIFVSKNKIYKLGDFSISKEVSELTMAHTKVGTFNYMAPEVFNNKPYTKNADIYSLGIVLYKLSNQGRMPFLPNHPNKILPKDIETSNMSRLSGKKISKPLLISDNLFSILKKACAYDQSARYVSATEMKSELEKIYNDSNDTPISFLESDLENESSNNFTHTYIELKELNKTMTYNKETIETQSKSDNANDEIEKPLENENSNTTKEFKKKNLVFEQNQEYKSYSNKNNDTNKTLNYNFDKKEDYSIFQNNSSNKPVKSEPKKNLLSFFTKSNLSSVYNNVFKTSIIVISIILIILLFKFITANSSTESTKDSNSSPNQKIETKTPEISDEKNSNIDSTEQNENYNKTDNKKNNNSNNNGNNNYPNNSDHTYTDKSEETADNSTSTASVEPTPTDVIISTPTDGTITQNPTEIPTTENPPTTDTTDTTTDNMNE